MRKQHRATPSITVLGQAVGVASRAIRRVSVDATERQQRTTQLGKNWSEHVTSSGDVVYVVASVVWPAHGVVMQYYYNCVTDTSTWEKPNLQCPRPLIADQTTDGPTKQADCGTNIAFRDISCSVSIHGEEKRTFFFFQLCSLS